MPTDTKELVLSSDAYEVLDCLAGGLDDIVLGIARAKAQKRDPNSSKIKVLVDDVTNATRELLSMIRQQIQSGTDDGITLEEWEVMTECVQQKLDEMGCDG